MAAKIYEIYFNGDRKQIHIWLYTYIYMKMEILGMNKDLNHSMGLEPIRTVLLEDRAF